MAGSVIDVYREAGVPMLPTSRVSETRTGRSFAGELVLAPLVGARHAVDAALRRLLRRVRIGHDARPRHAAAARVRPRLRALRPCGLARSPAHDRRDGRPPRARDPRLRGRAVAATCASAASTAASSATPFEGEADLVAEDASFAALYDALDRTTSTNKKVAALAAYFAAAPARGRGLGALFPHRPQDQAPHPEPRALGAHARSHRAGRSGSSSTATPPSATSRRRWRSSSISGDAVTPVDLQPRAGSRSA